MMKLNWVERLAVNNPVRALAHRYFETPTLLKIGGDCLGANAIEIGGGQGEGAKLIKRQFGAERVISMDLDELMVQRAKARIGNEPNILCAQADCTALPIASNAVDAIFDFGVIHHVIDWRKAVSELTRAAKPGAKLYAMEVYQALICHPVWKRILEHPQKDRFSHHDFIVEWQRQGWALIGDRQITEGFGWLVMQKGISSSQVSSGSQVLAERKTSHAA